MHYRQSRRRHATLASVRVPRVHDGWLKRGRDRNTELPKSFRPRPAAQPDVACRVGFSGLTAPRPWEDRRPRPRPSGDPIDAPRPACAALRTPSRHTSPGASSSDADAPRAGASSPHGRTAAPTGARRSRRSAPASGPRDGPACRYDARWSPCVAAARPACGRTCGAGFLCGPALTGCSLLPKPALQSSSSTRCPSSVFSARSATFSACSCARRLSALACGCCGMGRPGIETVRQHAGL